MFKKEEHATVGGCADRPRLIITADDFGRDPICTVQIAASLERGKITATSIMANGENFEQACAVAHVKGLTDKIGVHLVLDEGPPLSLAMRRFADRDGNLCVHRSLARFNSKLASAIEDEMSTQIERVIGAGIRPTHLDSHRHIHTAFPIGRLVVKLARKFNIGYVRPARNVARHSSVPASVYKWIFNRYVSYNVASARYFADIDDVVHHGYNAPRGSLVECMIHLDGSPRGISGQQLLESDEYRRMTQRYVLVDHLRAGY